MYSEKVNTKCSAENVYSMFAEAKHVFKYSKKLKLCDGNPFDNLKRQKSHISL